MAKRGGAPTKSEVLTHISKDTGLSRKQVGSVFDSLGGVIKKSLRGNGLFTMPGLLGFSVNDVANVRPNVDFLPVETPPAKENLVNGYLAAVLTAGCLAVADETAAVEMANAAADAAPNMAIARMDVLGCFIGPPAHGRAQNGTEPTITDLTAC